MTPDQVKEALDAATTDQLLAELLKRPTWQGIVVCCQTKGHGSGGKRQFVFRYSYKTLDRDKAIGVLSVAAEKLRLK